MKPYMLSLLSMAQSAKGTLLPLGLITPQGYNSAKPGGHKF